MKQLPLLIVCLLSLSIAAISQTAESFDISTFQAPKGWNKQTSQSSIQFSTEDKANGTYCLITLFTSLPGLGASKENFSAAWETIVKEAVNVSAPPQMFPSDNKEDWKVEGGFSSFEKNGEKSVAVLYTVSGYNKMVNCLVITNSMTYEPTITAFLDSFSFKKPPVGATAPAAATNGSDVSALVGTWGASSSNQSSYAVNNGLSGYIKKQYTFYPDGTYQFLVKTFQATSTQILFTKEIGHYQLVGDSLTITPQKGFIQAWSKGTVVESNGRSSQTDKWGKLLSTQNTKLETVTYRIKKNYFSGIQEWQLVMRSGAPTQRDGPFTTNADFPNSWLYATEKYPIDPPK